MGSQIYSLFAVLLVFGTALSQISNNLDFDDLQKQLKDSGVPNVADIEKKLQENGVTLPNLNTTQLDVQKVENVLTEKCKKQGAEDAVESLKNQQEVLKSCITDKVNISNIQDELEEAKKTGSMDEVFAKYCQKWPDVYQCVENVTVTVRSCMTEKEEKAFNKSLEIMEDLQEFMCFKDGDRLAMFVAEGGVECVQEQQEGIKNCLNATLGGRFPEPDEFSVATLPTFLFTEEDCQDFDKIRQCVNIELEKCKDTTPANIVDAFFKFLKKQMPCGKEGGEIVAKTAAATLNQNQTQGGNSAYSITNSILLVVGMVLLTKLG